MNAVRLFLSISLALFLCACASTHQRIGYHRIPVSWPPGYENVPDSSPLIEVQGRTLTIKGVTVTTPVGVGVGGGELNREDNALQVAADAALQADQKYTRLAQLLPAYANDQQAFYRARDQMFDLIKGTEQVASAVAAQTGQSPPVQSPAIPTAASDVAAGAGTNPAKGVANLPANVTSAADHLKQVAEKKASKSTFATPEIPQFPWPPPTASASDSLRRELLIGQKIRSTLNDVARALEAALSNKGYYERSYYGVLDGFAMACRIEQMNEDGTSDSTEKRFAFGATVTRTFSLSGYIRALFGASPGRYRVIVFVVASPPFAQKNVKPTVQQSEAWLRGGLTALPKVIGNREFSDDYKCTALIYEFKGTGKQAEFVEPSEIQGRTHLVKSGLLTALAQVVR